MFYQFDNYIVDKEKRRLLHNDDVLSDDEKTISLLCLLCENYPELVDKQLLIETLWPNQVVTDWSLSKLISDVRQLLGDTGKEQGFIKTIRGRGFRFNSEVTKHSKLEEQPKPVIRKLNKKLSYLFLSTILLVSLITGFVIWSFQSSDIDQSLPLRVAVLPVQSENQQPIDEWVKYGIMSIVSEQLAQYQSIQTLPVATVINSITSLKTKQASNEAQEQTYYRSICEQIGCSHVVVLKHRQENNNAVLSYQIYNSKSRSAISEFEQSDVFDSAAMLLDYLVSELIPNENQKIPLEDTFSTDHKANRDYAIGVNELLSGDPKAATDYLNLALQRRPDFFWAKAYLAEAQYRSGELTLATTLVEELMKVEANKTLQPYQLYFLLHLNSNILYTEGKLEASLLTSIELLNNSHVNNDPLLFANELLNIGSSYQATGDLNQALDYLQRAQAQYKLADYGAGEGKALYNLGNVFLMLSEKEKAIDYYQQAREVFIRFDMIGYALLAKHQIASTSIVLGRLQYAESELRLIVESYKKIDDVQGELTALLDLADVSFAKQDYEVAISRVEAVILKIDASELSYLQNHARRLAAVIYLRVGKVDDAERHFALFEGQWVDLRSSFAFVPAHLKQARGDFQGAVNIAKALKISMAENWTASHELVLKQFEESFSKSEIIAIIY
jgi:DNA-binding winged helix-turn-helix (wHTH) protein/tetratricopeptide (TPR) repeat protein